MSPLWQKLNLKDHHSILVLNAPNSFEAALTQLQPVNVMRNDDGGSEASFILAFVTSRAEIQTIVLQLIAKTTGDVIVWFSYPKGTSKRYSCDFNRDSGWEPLLDLGFTGVRQVAIDDDWSALRFRRSEYVSKNKKS